jgi:hypothetical protein
MSKDFSTVTGLLPVSGVLRPIPRGAAGGHRVARGRALLDPARPPNLPVAWHLRADRGAELLAWLTQSRCIRWVPCCRRLSARAHQGKTDQRAVRRGGPLGH